MKQAIHLLSLLFSTLLVLLLLPACSDLNAVKSLPLHAADPPSASLPDETVIAESASPESASTDSSASETAASGAPVASGNLQTSASSSDSAHTIAGLLGVTPGSGSAIGGSTYVQAHGCGAPMPTHFGIPSEPPRSPRRVALSISRLESQEPNAQERLLEVQRHLRRRLRAIQHCYHRTLDENSPASEAELSFSFSIAKSGRIEEVELQTNVEAEEASRCVESALRRVRYEASSVRVRFDGEFQIRVQ